MKKLIMLGLSIISMQSLSWSGNRRYFTDASDIITGTLSDLRLSVNVTTRTTQWSKDLDASTSTIANRLDQFSSTATGRMNQIVVGTTSIYGANIVGNNTQAFGFAMSSAANGGNIFIQKGDYFYAGITTVANVTMTFESSAVVKFSDAQRLDMAFRISSFGILNDVNIDISTSIYLNSHNPLIKMESGGQMNRANIRLITSNNVSGANYGGDGKLSGIIWWDSDARDTVVKDLLISSISFIPMNGGAAMNQAAENFNWFHISGGTNNWVINPRIYDFGGGAANAQAWRIGIDGPGGVDGFHLIGGFYQTPADLFSIQRADSGQFIRGFQFTGAKIVMTQNPSTALFQLLTAANVVKSSGNVISNLEIFYPAATTNPTISITGADNNGWNIFGNDIYHAVGGSGGGFSVGANSVGNIFRSNYIRGTTACMSDSGTATIYTSAGNICNSIQP